MDISGSEIENNKSPITEKFISALVCGTNYTPIIGKNPSRIRLMKDIILHEGVHIIPDVMA